MAETLQFAGVFPVLPTPFTRDGGVDLEALGPLVDFELSHGVDGLVVGGAAGELHKLSEDEGRELARAVVNRVHGRVPVILGIRHGSVESLVRLARDAEAAGGSAILVHPSFGAPRLAVLIDLFKELVDAVGVPVMLHDTPVPSAPSIPPEWIVELGERVEGLGGAVIETPPAGTSMTLILERSGGRIRVFGVSETELLDHLARGASGILSSAAVPDLAAGLYRAFCRKDRAGAGALLGAALPLLGFMSQSVEFSIVAAKNILLRRGVLPRARVRRPGAVFDEASSRRLDELLSMARIGEASFAGADEGRVSPGSEAGS